MSATTLHDLTDVELRTLLAGLWCAAAIGNGRAEPHAVRLALGAMAMRRLVLPPRDGLLLLSRIERATGTTLLADGRLLP